MKANIIKAYKMLSTFNRMKYFICKAPINSILVTCTRELLYLVTFHILVNIIILWYSKNQLFDYDTFLEQATTTIKITPKTFYNQLDPFQGK